MSTYEVEVIVSIPHSIFITVKAEDEDRAKELAERSVEYAVNPLRHLTSRPWPSNEHMLEARLEEGKVDIANAKFVAAGEVKKLLSKYRFDVRMVYVEKFSVTVEAEGRREAQDILDDRIDDVILGRDIEGIEADAPGDYGEELRFHAVGDRYDIEIDFDTQVE
ncbi:MAG: hypothetical protein EB060_11175 [Proteobacteria bacterium]|nr:hypothetical protein [Pseudomonadota bacterium]